jgi:hypothetical protein
MKYRDVMVSNEELTSDERNQFEWMLVLLAVYNETNGDGERRVTVKELGSKFLAMNIVQVGVALRWLYMCGWVTRIGNGVAGYPYEYRLSDAGEVALLGHVKSGLLRRS